MPGWDMAGPIRTQPGLGAALLEARPEPVREATALLWPPLEVAPTPSVVLDLSVVVGELARIHIALCQQRMEQQQMTAALVEALTPWYARLWRWIRSLGQ